MAEYTTIDTAVHEDISRKSAGAETVLRRTPTYRSSPYNAEISALLRHLMENNGSRRAEILRSLRKVLKKSGGQLPDVDRMEFFEAFYHMVGDSRWKVACECTMLIVDVIPQMGDHDLDPCMLVVLPRVIPNLGHESTDVRRATLRLLHVYMRYTNNLQKVLRMYVQYGLQSTDKNAQKGCILSLPLLFTEEFGNENLFPLVESLGNLLVDSEASLFYPVFLAIQRLHSLVGNETFRQYLQNVNPEAVMLYHRVLSRNSTANSGRNENADFNDIQNNNTVAIDKLITFGDTKPFDEFLKSDIEETTNGTENPVPFKPRTLFDAEFALRYGVFPPAALNRVLSTKLAEKNEGIHQILSVLRDAPSNHISALIPYLDAFMEDVVNKLVEHPNFKVTLYGLDMVEAVIERLKLSTQSFIKPIVKVLFKRLGDCRAVVREHNVKILHRMMFHFPPQHVIECILEQKYHRNPKIREEVVNRVTSALLMFPRTEFDLFKLCYEIAPMLVDTKRMVRLASLECCSVLAQALGHHRLAPLMAAVEATETGSGSEGLTNAVQARLSRRDLPRCNPDGTIRYVLNPMSFSGWFPSSADADLEWVMLASATNSGTPPKFPSINPSTYYFHPRHQRNVKLNSYSVKAQPPSTNNTELSDVPLSSGDSGKSELSSSEPVNILDFQTQFNFKEESKEDEESNRYASTGESSENAEVQDYDERNNEFKFTGKSETDFSNKPCTEEESDERRASFLSSVSNNLNIENEKSVQSSKQDLTEKPQNRQLRAFSMPTISSEILSDISEKSTEGSQVTGFLGPESLAHRRKSSTKFPHSVPSSPKRMCSMTSYETDVYSERPKSELKFPENVREEHRRASVAFAIPPPTADGTDSESHVEEQEKVRLVVSRDGSRRSSVGSAPASPKSPQQQLGDNIPALKPAESLPSICLPTNESENNEALQNQANEISETEPHTIERKDAQTQKDESDLSSCTTSTPETKLPSKVPVSRTPGVRRKPMIPVRRRVSRSISPQPRKSHFQMIRIQPAIPANANIRHILENVAKTEGPFNQPEEALRAAISTFTQDTWTTKVEGMLAITRLASFHPQVLQKELHIIVLALVYEVKNLRSSVSRSAIFTLGDLFKKMRKQIEPELELICQALVHKCGENIAFIREDIDKALANLVEEMPQTKSALALIHSGAHHRNMNVRKTAAQFLQYLVDKMGSTKCLMGPRDIGEHLLPAAAKFVMDGNPVTRYYGRKIFSCLMQHSAFDKLLRKHITPGTYRNICGILESIKRRGIGEKPADLLTPAK